MDKETEQTAENRVDEKRQRAVVSLLSSHRLQRLVVVNVSQRLFSFQANACSLIAVLFFVTFCPLTSPIKIVSPSINPVPLIDENPILGSRLAVSFGTAFILLMGLGEGEVVFFSAKRWDRRNRADLIESATPCHDAQVVGLYRDSNPNP